MKKIDLLNITYKGTLLYKFNGSIFENSLEGFIINSSIQSRVCFLEIMGLSMECTLSKTGSIRFKNIQKLTRLLKHGAIKINQLDMGESKIFTNEEKKQLQKCIEQKSQYIPQKQIIDLSSQPNLLKKYFSKQTELQLPIEYLSDDIIFRMEDQSSMTFIPVKVRNLKHYFQLVNQEDFAQFFEKYSKIKVKILPPVFNIAKNKYQCEAIFPQEIQQYMVERGWATIQSKNACMINVNQFKVLQKLEATAQNKEIGIYKKPFEIFNFVYSKSNFVAVVEQVLEGNIINVRDKNNEKLRVELAFVCCPLERQLGAFQCREFARKNLIGKQVSIMVKQRFEFQIIASIIRLSDNKDFETLLIEKGWGSIKGEYEGSMVCKKLENLAKKAKQTRRGLHEQEKIGFPHFEDFTLHINKKDVLIREASIEKKVSFLKKMEPHTEAVLEKMLDPVTFIVRIDDLNKIIRMKLEGVHRNTANLKLKEMEKLYEAIEQFWHKKLIQRTVFLQIIDFDESENNFIGFIRIKQKGKRFAIQQSLIKEGFVYVGSSGQKQWFKSQKIAKKQGINIWNDQLKNFNRKNLLQNMPKQFQGTISWIQNRQTFYVQPLSETKNINKITDILNITKLENLKPENIILGHLCACKFEGEYARATILSIQKQQILIHFIDWGNRVSVKSDQLMEIPNQLHYYPSCCCEVRSYLPKLSKIPKDKFDKEKNRYLGAKAVVVKKSGNSVNLLIK